MVWKQHSISIWKNAYPATSEDGGKIHGHNDFFHGVAYTDFAWNFLIEVATEYIDEWT